ncbi:MAG: alkene reductase [Zoogloeaceae bacterium]|jgi:2,4-dienoyl-CoA reductase-like NADH-dependent reductase (Old Yellow Enzyme family)|nr:alkene reductase [Zoogloeaceae bacterium]
MPTLFDPITLGDIALKNRLVMSPLTRCRAGDGRVPNALMAEYYRARASAGLIITEATAISPMSVGYPDTPGLWTAAQVEGWRQVVEGVHAAGGKIIPQIWHVGRLSDPEYLAGQQPVAPSAVAAEGHVSLLRPLRPYPVPRALKTEEIPGIIADFKTTAVNAKAAGFDGIELHAANGYLIEQFLTDSVNHRTDAYGGSIENRARLLLEVTDAFIEVWGASSVGVHLSPRLERNHDSNPAPLFTYIARELGLRKIAFIFLREAEGPDALRPVIKSAFGGPVIANERLTQASAARLVAEGEADAAAFGECFIANPDLVRRFAQNAPLNPPRSELYYTGGAEGYTDYPTLAG